MIEAFENLDVSDSIEAVDECSIEVKTQDDEVVATSTIYVVKIGNSWYVDNSNSDTTPFYVTMS